MVTKYIREPGASAARAAPFQRHLARSRPVLRKRWNLLILVTIVLVVLLHGFGPPPVESPPPIRGEAIVEAREIRQDATGTSHWIRVTILREDGNIGVWTRVDPQLYERYTPGARVAVLYDAAQGLFPTRVRELGMVALPAADEYP